jgi:hypothetical protein
MRTQARTRGAVDVGGVLLYTNMCFPAALPKVLAPGLA